VLAKEHRNGRQHRRPSSSNDGKASTNEPNSSKASTNEPTGGQASAECWHFLTQPPDVGDGARNAWCGNSINYWIIPQAHRRYRCSTSPGSIPRYRNLYFPKGKQ